MGVGGVAFVALFDPFRSVEGLTLGPISVSGTQVTMEAPKQIGSYGKHLALRLQQDVAGSRNAIRCVWWNEGSRAADLAAGMRLDVAVEPKLNAWNGRVSVEAEVRDVLVCAQQRV